MNYAEKILREVNLITSLNNISKETSRMDGIRDVSGKIRECSKVRKDNLVSYITSVRQQRKSLKNQDGGDILIVDGGPGSGNWGHEGRPGKVGGSGKGGGIANRLSTPSGGFTSRSQAEKENRQRNKSLSGGSTGTEKKGSSEKKSQPSNKPPKVESKTLEQMTREGRTDKELFISMRKRQGVKYKDGLAEDRDYDSFENPKGVRRKEIIKEYGSVDNWREKQIHDYTEEDRAQLEEKMSCLQDGTSLNREYEKKIVKPMEREYSKNTIQYSDYDNDIKPTEYYELQKESMRNMTTEDFAILQNSYYHGGRAYGSDYTDYTRKKINGEELNWAQKRLEQIVDEHSVEIPEGRTVFRKTSEEEFKALTGKSLSEFSNNVPASERTAVIQKATSFGTALQYNGFYTQNIIIEYTTKKGAKAFFTTNTDELEGIFPPGTKISNIKVNQSSSRKIPSIERKSRSTTDAGGLSKANYKMTNIGQKGWYDFTYSGGGQFNANKQREKRMWDVNYNGTTNDCVRVTVEVEPYE